MGGAPRETHSDDRREPAAASEAHEIGKALGIWTDVPGAGPIRTSTLITAAILFAVITVATRSPFRALVALIAWVSLFELTYQAIGIAGFGWALANFPWEFIALSGWLVLAAWIGVWPDWRITILFAAIMAAWMATGYQYNVAGQTSPIDIRNEVLNEGGKVALALAYLVGAARPAFRPLGGRPSIR